MKTQSTKKLRSIVTGLTFVMFASSVLHAQSVDQGLKLIQYEKVQEGRNIIKQVADKEPSNVEANFYMGKLLLAEGKTAEADAYFQKAMNASSKKNALGNVGLGMSALAKGDSSKAEEYFEEAIDITDYKDPKVVVNIADAYIITPSKNTKIPLEALNKAKGLKNVDTVTKAMYFEKIGDVYYKHNNMSQAVSNYQNALYTNRKSLSAYVGVGKIYGKIKNYSEAEESLIQATKMDPSYAPAYKELGELYYTLNKYAQAQEMYKKFIENSEPSVENSIRYATIAYLAKDYNTALNTLKAAESKDPNNMVLHHIIAFSYYSMKDSANAIQAFDKYFAVAQPKDISATDYEYYARMLEKVGQEQKAVENFEKSIALDSTNADLHGDIAAIYFKNKDYANATKHYDQKMKYAKKGLSLRELFDFGQAYFYMKDFAKSDSVFAIVTEKAPELALGHLWRAFATSSIDTTSELGLAKPHYEKFISIASKTPEKFTKNLIQAYSYLGYYYFLKREDPAFKDVWLEQYKTNWEKVKELDPANQQATEALKNLKIFQK